MIETVAVVLAGGLARRMGGGDKCRLAVGGRSVLQRTLDTVGPQVAELALNANGDSARFADIGLPVLADSVPGHPGPLAGILAGLDWASGLGAPWLLSVPGDCPFLPGDLVARLHFARGDAVFSVAASGGWAHPVVALWPVALRDELRDALRAGERKIDAYTARHPTARAEWAMEPVDPFFNVNSPRGAGDGKRDRRTGSATRHRHAAAQGWRVVEPTLLHGLHAAMAHDLGVLRGREKGQQRPCRVFVGLNWSGCRPRRPSPSARHPAAGRRW